MLDKIGEGSFGTVWTARDRRCTEATAPLVALKRINPTCSPSRILNEYQQMRMLGGKLLCYYHDIFCYYYFPSLS